MCETGFQEGGFPFCYLGVPIVSGRLKVVHVDDMVQKVCGRIGGWKTKLLSQGARLILIRHILMSLPMHLLSCIHVPKAVLERINECLRKFFWGSSDG